MRWADLPPRPSSQTNVCEPASTSIRPPPPPHPTLIFAARQTCLCHPTNVPLPPDKYAFAARQTSALPPNKYAYAADKHAFAARQICICHPTNTPLPPDNYAFAARQTSLCRNMHTIKSHRRTTAVKRLLFFNRIRGPQIRMMPMSLHNVEAREKPHQPQKGKTTSCSFDHALLIRLP